jgi:hypothetical protein
MSFDNKGYWQTVDIDDPLNAGASLGEAHVIVCTIGPAGGTDNQGNAFDYNTINDWYWDVHNYSPTNDQHTDRLGNGPFDIIGAPFWAECYSGGSLLATSLTMGPLNYAATSTHFLRIYAADGHRANGLFDPRGFTDDQDIPQGAFCKALLSMIVGNNDYARLEGLRYIAIGKPAMQITAQSSDHVLVRGNTFQLHATSTTGLQPHGILCTLSSIVADAQLSRTVIMRNNVAYGDGTGKNVAGFLAGIMLGREGQQLALTLYQDNNTVVNCGGEVDGDAGGAFYTLMQCSIATSQAEMVIYRRNNLALKPDKALCCYLDEKTGAQTGGLTFTYEAHENNLSNDTTADDYGGGTSDGNIADVAPAEVVYSPATDARLRRNSPAVSAGKDLSDIFTTDLRGRTRRTWDIGAFAYYPVQHAGTNPTPSTSPAMM